MNSTTTVWVLHFLPAAVRRDGARRPWTSQILCSRQRPQVDVFDHPMRLDLHRDEEALGTETNMGVPS